MKSGLDAWRSGEFGWFRLFATVWSEVDVSLFGSRPLGDEIDFVVGINLKLVLAVRAPSLDESDLYGFSSLFFLPDTLWMMAWVQKRSTFRGASLMNTHFTPLPSGKSLFVLFSVFILTPSFSA